MFRAQQEIPLGIGINTRRRMTAAVGSPRWKANLTHDEAPGFAKFFKTLLPKEAILDKAFIPSKMVSGNEMADRTQFSESTFSHPCHPHLVSIQYILNA